MAKNSIIDPLRSPWLKLDWARKNVADFNSRFSAWKDSRPYELVTNLNPQKTEYVVKIVRRRDFPEDLLVVIADAIHNFRSALDHLAFAFAERVRPALSEKALKSVYFPIGSSPDSFSNKITERKKLRVFSRKVAKFFGKFEPWKGGNGEILFILDKLNNIEKHRIVIDLLSTDMVRVTRHGQNPARFWINMGGERKKEIARYPVDSDTHYDSKVMYNVTFDEVYGEKYSLKIIGTIRERVGLILNAAEAEFFS